VPLSILPAWHDHVSLVGSRQAVFAHRLSTAYMIGTLEACRLRADTWRGRTATAWTEDFMADLTAAVTDLSKTFSGHLLLPSDPGYDAARRVHNGLVDKRPELIARCRGAADIADAVRLAREFGLEIAVRGGGHNVSGRATVEGGAMVDLSLMQHVHVDSTARTATVAGGTLWGQFNRETQLHGLATTGGVVSTTGVAGLTLGGGLGWLMPKYGMALDNLLGADVVLADGRAVSANASQNPDLFWALRGGGGNFGVASSFTFTLHEVGPIVTGGLVAWTFDHARDVLRLFRDLAATATDDMMLVAALLTAPDGKTKLAAIGAGHFGTAAIAEAAVRPLKTFGQPVMDGLGPIPYGQLNTLLDDAFPKGARNYWKSHFLSGFDDGLIDTVIDRFQQSPTPMTQLLFEHFHGAPSRVAPEATPFGLRSPGFNGAVLGQWIDPADDTRVTGWCRDTFAAIQPYVGASRYVNYLDQDDTGDEALVAVYGPNVKRLRELKAKYDPENVFHLNLNIPPGP
jgi:FAD/FMN-containing dehydrogenase